MCDINEMPILERIPAYVIRGICKRRYEYNKKKAKEVSYIVVSFDDYG